ncbi:MAG: SDR family NAD(P)-dependent oxidoreductase, partial [Kaistella sp.]
MKPSKTVLILGANSDVAKQCILQYVEKGFAVSAASRDLISLKSFVAKHHLEDLVQVIYFDAVDFSSHRKFYNELPAKPNIVVYAAGFLRQNEDALQSFDGAFQMMKVNYAGA